MCLCSIVLLHMYIVSIYLYNNPDRKSEYYNISSGLRGILGIKS